MESHCQPTKNDGGIGYLIEALSDPSAYAERVERVDVRQTHISVVFLAGPNAYKIKKPVDLGFLDFSTLEKRRHFCDEEVRLNRRLAPSVYLGVVPVTCSPSGVRMEGQGDVVEWAVKMERLPDEVTLQRRLQSGDVQIEVIDVLARRLAAFHARSERTGRVSSFGRFEVVASNARENFDQAKSNVGISLSHEVFERLQALNETVLARLRPLIESRADRGVPCDTHGDLHLDHVYFFPERSPPDDLIIIDCIEFNERFRYADPVADAAFLIMDLLFQGRRDLARGFSDKYFQASGDEEGRALLPFYTAYRAAVRGKVEGLKLAEREVPEFERTTALVRARGHWLLSLRALEEPGRRPGVVLVGGLPGTGKSTLAKALAERAGFCLIRSDEVRKELASLPETERAPSSIYSVDWTERTYAKCLRRSEVLLFQGKRVLIDASFWEEASRQAFLDMARRWAVPAVVLVCHADVEVIRKRLQSRRNDASDADWSTYLEMAKQWQEPAPATRQLAREVSTGKPLEQILIEVFSILREFDLLS